MFPSLCFPSSTPLPSKPSNLLLPQGLLLREELKACASEGRGSFLGSAPSSLDRFCWRPKQEGEGRGVSVKVRKGFGDLRESGPPLPRLPDSAVVLRGAEHGSHSLHKATLIMMLSG